MSLLQFSTTVTTSEKAGSGLLLVLPQGVSEKLPSKGMVMVVGGINKVPLQTTLEPDGNGSHWCKLRPTLVEAANLHEGSEVSVEIEPLKSGQSPRCLQTCSSSCKNIPMHLLPGTILPQWHDGIGFAGLELLKWPKHAKNELILFLHGWPAASEGRAALIARSARLLRHKLALSGW